YRRRTGRRCELCLVPEADDARLALEAEHADAARREEQAPAEAHGLLGPARPERAEDVAVGEDRDVAVDRQDLLDDAVAAGCDLGRRLAVREAVAPQVPAGLLLADLRRRDALVVAVVPLEEVLADLAAVAEPGQTRGLARAVERAREHEREVVAVEAAGELPRALAPGVGQRDVRAARVPPRLRPLGLGVADEPHPPRR